MPDKENIDPEIKIHKSATKGGPLRTPKNVPHKIISRQHLKRSAYRKQSIKSSSISHMRWKEAEDHRLINAMQKFLNGERNHEKIPWTKVADEMGNRTGMACKLRWKRQGFQDRLRSFDGASNLILSPSQNPQEPSSKKKMKKAATTVLLSSPRGKAPSRMIRSNDDPKIAIDCPMGVEVDDIDLSVGFFNDIIPLDFKRTNPEWSNSEAKTLLSILCENEDDQDMHPSSQNQIIQFTPLRFTNSAMALPLIPTPYHIRNGFHSDSVTNGDELKGIFYDQSFFYEQSSMIEFPSNFVEIKSPQREKRKTTQLLPQTPFPSPQSTKVRKASHEVSEVAKLHPFASKKLLVSPIFQETDEVRNLNEESKSTSDHTHDIEYESPPPNCPSENNSHPTQQLPRGHLEDSVEMSPGAILDLCALSISDDDGVGNVEDLPMIFPPLSSKETSITTKTPINEGSSQRSLSSIEIKKAIAKKFPIFPIASSPHCNQNAVKTPFSSFANQNRGGKENFHQNLGPSMSACTPAIGVPPFETPLIKLDNLLNTSSDPSAARRSESSSVTTLINLGDVLGTSAAPSTAKQSESSSDSPHINLEELLGTSTDRSNTHSNASLDSPQFILDGKKLNGTAPLSTVQRNKSSKVPHFNTESKILHANVAPTTTSYNDAMGERSHLASENFLGSSCSTISNLTPENMPQDFMLQDCPPSDIEHILSPEIKKKLFDDSREATKNP